MHMIKQLVAAAAMMSMAGSALAAGEIVLVAGATGKTGRPAIEILKGEGYKVRALVRDAAKAADLGEDVEFAVGDVTKPETLTAAAKGADFVISAIGTGRSQKAEDIEYGGVAALVDAAKAAGVKQFVLVSSLNAGSTDTNEFLNKAFGMLLMWKGEGEKYLRESGVPYTIVRPGGLRPFPNEQSCEGGEVGLKVAPFNDTGMGAVCRTDLAAVLVNALGNPDAVGKTFSLISDEHAPVDKWKSDIAALPKD
ncbi:MAG: SDR family oxidoreductase [Rhodobacteraceae bacterium]|nr:SDR family oxidoreductase [Paracoccaceae bacterium]